MLFLAISAFDSLNSQAQISFHNCHIPFIGSKKGKESCAQGETCRARRKGEAPFTDEELDYYACLVELDNAVGIILKALKSHGYYDNTMVRFIVEFNPQGHKASVFISSHISLSLRLRLRFRFSFFSTNT